MNLLPGRAQRHHFFEERDEVAAGVASRGSSVHAAGFGVQRGIEAKRSVALVLEALTVEPSLGFLRVADRNRARKARQNRGLLDWPG